MLVRDEKWLGYCLSSPIAGKGLLFGSDYICDPLLSHVPLPLDPHTPPLN